MPVDDQEPRYRLAIQDVDGNIVDRLGTLYAESDGTLKIQEGSGSFNEASLNPDGTFSVPTAPVNADEVARKQEIDGKADKPHDLGGDDHSEDTLENLNSKVSDATLDDTDDPREPETHGETHENGGVDEINVSGLSGVLEDDQTSEYQNNGTTVGSFSTVDAQTALIADDNNGTLSLSVDTAAIGNEPDWTEDPNSPQTYTDVTTVSYNLANDYDIILADVFITNSSDFSTVDLRFNNVETDNYRYIRRGGDQFVGENEIRMLDSSNSLCGSFKLVNGDQNDEFKYHPESIGTSILDPQSGKLEDAPNSIDSFQIIKTAGDGIDLTLQVYGRDIA